TPAQSSFACHLSTGSGHRLHPPGSAILRALTLLLLECCPAFLLARHNSLPGGGRECPALADKGATGNGGVNTGGPESLDDRGHLGAELRDLDFVPDEGGLQERYVYLGHDRQFIQFLCWT